MTTTECPDQRSMAQRTEKSRLVSAMSGSLSGACVSAIVQPLDVVRTRMQVDVNRGVHVSAWGTLRTITQEVGAPGKAGPSI